MRPRKKNKKKSYKDSLRKINGSVKVFSGQYKLKRSLFSRKKYINTFKNSIVNFM